MKPMLARTYGPKYSHWPCYVQPKLNGVRALVQLVPYALDKKTHNIPHACFQSRDEKLWKQDILRHLSVQLEVLDKELGSTILDGELYVHGWKLQRINSAIAVKRLEPTGDTPSVCFHVFDVVDPTRPFSERWIPMRNLLAEANLPHIRPVDTSMVHDSDQLQRYFHMAVSAGYEGVMLRPDGPYEFGETSHGTQKRSKFLWKHKSWVDDEFICSHVTEGEGKADIGIGALWCFSKNGTLFKVGTGFDDEERTEFMNNPPVGKQIRVRYLCLTDEGKPFNASFIAVM